jgi:hypothetical protein
MKKSYLYALIKLVFALGVGYFSWGIYSFLVEAKSLEIRYLVLTISVTLISLFWFAWTYMLSKPAWAQLNRKWVTLFVLLHFVLLVTCLVFRLSDRFPSSVIASLIISLSFSGIILSSAIAYYLRERSKN